MFSSKDQIQDRETGEENRKYLEIRLGAGERCAAQKARMSEYKEKMKRE